MQRAGGAAMTHPITPPPELVAQWVAQAWHEGTPVQVAASDLHITTQAAQWGADQELETILEMVGFGQQSLPEEDRYLDGLTVASIRAARRPKPPSLKEQAFAAFKNSPVDSDSEMLQLSADAELIIRLALEALPND